MRRSNWTIFRVVSGVAALVAMSVPMTSLLGDTTLNSGTTTVSTGSIFGTNLYGADTGTATLVIAGGLATDTYGWIGKSARGPIAGTSFSAPSAPTARSRMSN